ncbi:hypothetical protein HPB48_003797 [Haemaphysalis longicornis]|uniref:Uncharacterized protein n=1 Tax=Haemaphysalis longicornis TaxID=44386 RepID=A0A9J6FFE2_HAELO|nr:hypothetical protein HPB48_003797 [Haemaphysalis longicornis]
MPHAAARSFPAHVWRNKRELTAGVRRSGAALRAALEKSRRAPSVMDSVDKPPPGGKRRSFIKMASASPHTTRRPSCQGSRRAATTRESHAGNLHSADPVPRFAPTGHPASLQPESRSPRVSGPQHFRHVLSTARGYPTGNPGGGFGAKCDAI